MSHMQKLDEHNWIKTWLTALIACFWALQQYLGNLNGFSQPYQQSKYILSLGCVTVIQHSSKSLGDREKGKVWILLFHISSTSLQKSVWKHGMSYLGCTKANPAVLSSDIPDSCWCNTRTVFDPLKSPSRADVLISE